MIVSYEIHTFVGGEWKIDSIFDSRDLALSEARRIDEGKRYSAVRVIEESFDEGTQRVNSRTIYRGSKIDDENADALERKKRVRTEVQARDAKKKIEKKQAARAQAQKTKKKNFQGAMLMVFLKATGIVIFGAGVIIGIRYLALHF
ncbi:MAG: hypothetical protein J4G10_06945 [Alphaproteobacteria bacterium]|nr:hypothetical protein [Alphaproteobacteria bacterium]